MFSPKSFIVLGLTFKSSNHLDLIFAYGVKKGPTSFFCTWIEDAFAFLMKKYGCVQNKEMQGPEHKTNRKRVDQAEKDTKNKWPVPDPW